MLPLNRLYLSHTLTEPMFGATTNEFFYVRAVDGKRAVYRQSAQTGYAQAITTEPAPAGGVGYGQGFYAARDTTLIYAAKDNRLHGIDLITGEQWVITPAYEGVALPVISPCGGYVAFLAEERGHCHLLLTDVRGRALPIQLSQNPWYAFNPAFSPDGRWIAWMEWDEFQMPWTEARIVAGRFAKPAPDCALSVELLPLHTRALAKPRVTCAAPQFSPNSRFLAYMSDESGWRTLWVSEVQDDDVFVNPIHVDTGPGEVGGPDWVPGRYRARWNGDSTALYALRRRESRDTLLRITWPERAITEVYAPPAMFTEFNVRGDEVLLQVSSPSHPPILYTLDGRVGQLTPRVTAAVGLYPPLASAEVLSWQTVNGGPCWGVLYRATGPDADKQPRPLIVEVHGGPTSEWPLMWHAQAQYFATRGWHYLFVNHRGGTGFGRAYQDLLDGQWGVVDVEDARTGAQHLIDRGLADASRLVITGGSAGGYTTLMALVQDPSFWAAGVSFFGLGNMYDLRLGSHRFEVNYEFNLIGKLPEAGPLWKQRSPLTYIKNLRAPVQLFHGKEDKAVPYQQSVDFAAAAQRQGVPAELVLYDEEGHGFTREKNRRDCVERMERFLDKYVLCLQSK